MKTATEITEKPLSRISASQHAVEKLHLLEKVQGNASWQTSIVANSMDDVAQLQELQKDLSKGRYVSTLTTDAYNRPVLEIEHIGNDTGIIDSFQKLGAVKGFQVTTEKVQDGVGSALNGTKNFFDSPVKFLSGFYLMADALFTASGFAEKDASGDALQGPAKWLKASVGIFSAMQSAIFLHYGEDKNKHHLSEIEREVNYALKEGNDPLQFLTDDSQLGKHHNPVAAALLDNPVTRFVTDNDFLREHPIVSGAGAWIAGQSALLASAMIRRNDIMNNPNIIGEARDSALTSANADIKRSLTSITGWLILMMDQKHTEEKTPITQNPFKWAIEHIQESPQVYSGLIALQASVFGLEGGNPLMQAAEVANISGDMAMFFTKKSEYGGETFGDPKVLAEALAGFLERAPIMFSPATEQKLVKEMAGYFAEKTQEQADVKGKTLPPDFAEKLYNHTIAELAGKPRSIDKVAFHVAEITSLFPESQQEAVRQSLVDKITEFRAVMVDKGELTTFAEQAQNNIVQFKRPETVPNITELSDKLADLTFALPAIHAGEHASALFDVVQQAVVTTPASQKIFQRALTDKAAEDLGVTAQELQQMMQQAGVIQQQGMTTTIER